MTTRPTVLVLEDSRTERDELTTLLNGLGLDVWPTSSITKARNLIAANPDFDLAVIDWDMAHSDDSAGEPTSQRVLELLAGKSRDTLTIVYARNLMRVTVNADIQRAHPAALLHDKSQGADTLEQRLVKILSAQVGDLELDERLRNHVRHIPTGKLFKHRAAFKLMAHYPRDVVFPREMRAMWTGMNRFRLWLDEVGSSVTVVSMGMATHRYRIALRESLNASDDRRTA